MTNDADEQTRARDPHYVDVEDLPVVTMAQILKDGRKQWECVDRSRWIYRGPDNELYFAKFLAAEGRIV